MMRSKLHDAKFGGEIKKALTGKMPLSSSFIQRCSKTLNQFK